MTPAARCPFCHLEEETVLTESEYSVAILTRDPVLVASAMIIPRSHRATPFDLSPEEGADTFTVALAAKARLDREFAPDGYNVGWNCGAVAGQEVAHAHMHLIGRFNDEPLAGRGIRWALKQPANQRL